jgi:hypothetical protein
MKEPAAMSIVSSDDTCDVHAWPWALDPSVATYRAHPLVDADSAWVLVLALSELSSLRCPALGMTDALAELHAALSLLRQGRVFIPDIVADARLQDRSWAEIAAQLEIAPAAARRRYGPR